MCMRSVLYFGLYMLQTNLFTLFRSVKIIFSSYQDVTWLDLQSMSAVPTCTHHVGQRKMKK